MILQVLVTHAVQGLGTLTTPPPPPDTFALVQCPARPLKDHAVPILGSRRAPVGNSLLYC